MLESEYAEEEGGSKVAVGVPAECFGGDPGRPVVAADYSRHDASGIPDLQGVPGILTTERNPSDGRKLIYSLTPKGIDLAPVLTEMVLWAAEHEHSGNPALVRQIQKDKQQFMNAVRQRWAETTRAAKSNFHGKTEAFAR